MPGRNGDGKGECGGGGLEMGLGVQSAERGNQYLMPGSGGSPMSCLTCPAPCAPSASPMGAGHRTTVTSEEPRFIDSFRPEPGLREWGPG